MDFVERMRNFADRFDIERGEDVASRHFGTTYAWLFWKIIIWLFMVVMSLNFISSLLTLAVVTEIYKVSHLGNTTFFDFLTRV